MTGPIQDIKVLDLSWGTAGPMTTMMLADAGADVVRIERPAGDPFVGQSGYTVWHRGKRSATIDLTSDDGRAAFHDLVATADVVVESFGPGTAERLAADHSTMSAINPRLITLSISAYGDHPDHCDRTGYDALVMARTGLLFDQKGRRGTAMEYINGREGPMPEFGAPDGLVRGADRPGPVFPRSTWPSIGATYLATLGVAAALRARETTGRGQHVTTSLLQGALAAVALNWQRVEKPDAPLYWMWPIDSRSIEGIYQCKDGRWVHHWTIRPNWVLTAASGGDHLTPPDLEGEYRDDPDRVSMEEDGLLTGIFLHEQFTEAFGSFDSSEWVAAADDAQMGVALVRSPDEALADPAYVDDGCVVQVDDPELGPIKHCGPLLEFSATPGRVRGPRHLSGADTEEVLAGAGWTAGQPRPVAGSDTGDTLQHPLSGVRVLDLGLGVAGPFAGRALADLGADVVKIHAMYDGYWSGTHMGLGTNRGKRSIALNLKHPEGRAVLDRLVETADVITTNWRPGAAARLGLDFESLKAINPRIVFCNSRGYERGPRSSLPGTDQTAAALSGTEYEDGAVRHGNPPLWSRSNMGDTGNALLSAIAITMALYHRDRTGEGQQVGTSIVNAGLLHTSYSWIHGDDTPGHREVVDADQFGFGPTYRMYQSDDDVWVFVGAVQEHEREALAELIGVGVPLEDDPDKVVSVIGEFIGTRSAADAIAALDAAGVPAELIDEEFCRDLFDDPEAIARDLVSETWAGAVGRFEDPGLLVGFSDTPGVIQRGPAMCGEHTRELMLECGFTDADVDRLAEEKAVLDAPVDHP